MRESVDIQALRGEVQSTAEAHHEWQRRPPAERPPADEVALIAARHDAEARLHAAIKESQGKP